MELFGKNDVLDLPQGKDLTFLEVLQHATLQLWSMGTPQESSFAPQKDDPEKEFLQYNDGPALHYRPSLQHVGIKDERLREFLKQCFFLPSGYLRPDLRRNINFDASHGLIKFDRFESTDVRWYLPFVVVPANSQGMFCCLYHLNSFYSG
jgi:hypothetical protein